MAFLFYMNKGRKVAVKSIWLPTFIPREKPMKVFPNRDLLANATYVLAPLHCQPA